MKGRDLSDKPMSVCLSKELMRDVRQTKRETDRLARDGTRIRIISQKPAREAWHK